MKKGGFKKEDDIEGGDAYNKYYNKLQYLEAIVVGSFRNQQKFYGFYHRASEDS